MSFSNELLIRVEERRRRVNPQLDPITRSELGQFMTPAPVARVLADCINIDDDEFRLLDPGAGIGSLTAAVVARILDADRRPEVVSLTAFEVDETMRGGLAETLADCKAALERVGVKVVADIVPGDFVEFALEDNRTGAYSAAILNPPFMKISARSNQADRIRARGWSAANLYTAFWCAAVDQVGRNGDIVAITPRSFCNGSYFASFRHFLLKESALRSIHVFDARDKAFSDDGVLQETVVTHSVKGGDCGIVELAISHQPGSIAMRRAVSSDDVVHPEDRAAFIRLPVDEAGEAVREWMSRLHHSLPDLGLTVSTGPVVDFRARDRLRMDFEPGLVPLFYPTHMSEASINWPKAGARKPNAFVPAGAEKLLTADGHYTIVKRFSAKEERRRVVASYYDGTLGRPVATGGISAVALENHLNYFHMKGRPLPDWMARGLTMYLNSTVVDTYFREFNGHTQVNAGDLRSLRYPGPEQLRILGKAWERGLSQAHIDAAVEAL
jgi:adenine-specific DNA-methyltransferase